MERAQAPNVRRRLFDARVIENVCLCREHHRIVLSGAELGGAQPGQFLHIGPRMSATPDGAGADGAHASAVGAVPVPLLRRAFSIAGVRRRSGATCEMDVIYRIVGVATRWLASLRVGDVVSVLGPLGNAFPIRRSKSCAWLVGGGVGLPPMLWLAQGLHAAHRRSVAFVGARSADLLALTLTDRGTVSSDASRAVPVAKEFARWDTPVVISTDDGSLGYRGHAAGAMSSFFDRSQPDVDDHVVYTCGPERMMEAVARFCAARAIECHVCMERAMACGTGTCQSCVVTVHDEAAVDGWRYALCCTEGPVFDATRVIWPADSGGGVQH